MAPREVKLSRTAPEKSLHYFADKLGVKHKFLVVGEQERPGRAADVHVLDAPSFLAPLPV